LTILTTRAKGSNSDTGSRHDATLEAGSITINQDGYDATLDRIYDVKGLENMHVEIQNTHATNGLIYKIEKARKEFTEVGEVVTGDFNKDILGNTTVLALVAATGTITLVTALAGDIVTINGLTYTAATDFEVDIGIGPSGSEEVLIPNVTYHVSVAGLNIISVPYPFKVEIPAGSRISARASNAAVQTVDIDINITGT